MRLLLIVVFVLMLAGGGVAGWWVWLRGGDLTELVGMGREEAEEQPHEPLFYELEAFAVPILQEGRVTRILTLVISLEVEGASRFYVSDHKRPLRDAIFSELHALMSLDTVRARGPTSELVRKRLRVVSNRILGGDLVQEVLVQAVQSRSA